MVIFWNVENSRVEIHLFEKLKNELYLSDY
jgi:hypothetical protein